ncbi:MAG: NlpC/P60 family protein [Bacteroidota bacterium]|nr:NlpC/P60 family protein [Bacteroidota bacterium]MDE2833245.1 NlpC/P60 family protein [Bacteroidota bacterium]MDE2957571.1 NlpC/P60 family protein [Bacteroidota bacterium]
MAVESGSSVARAADLEPLLRSRAQEWVGVPYLEGGDSRAGVDAPALVQILAGDVLGVELPRSTTRQLGVGEEIRQQDLLAGDIVFFRPTNRPRHVGIYLGSREFIHSWPESDVSIVRLDDSYWSGAFWAGRRIVADTVSTQPIQAQEERTPRHRTRRVGW